MPRRNVHIRDEDLPTWELLPNKSEFVSLALNRRDLTDRYRGKLGPDNKRFHKPVDVVTPQIDPKKGWGVSTVKEPAKLPDDKKVVLRNAAIKRGKLVAVKTCDHGQPKGECLVVKCPHSRYKKR